MKNRGKWLGRTLFMVLILLMTFSVGVFAASPKLNKKKLTLKVGESYTLKLKNYKGSDAIQWKSSNYVKASISTSGRVVARKPGKVKLTAVAGKKKYNCTLTVKQPVTKINLNASTVSLVAGKTKTVKATASPSNASNKKVKWSSSNKKVATVTSAGKVKAIAPGNAVITATAKDGSKVKASCNVTVTAKESQLVKKIALDRNALNMVVGNKETLVATVSPSNAKNKKVKWSSSDTTIAKVSSSGKVSAKKAGTAVITVTAKDGSGAAASCTVTVIPKENHRYKDGNVNITGVKQMGQSLNASKFLACLEMMSNQVEKDYKKGTPWVYGGTNNRLWEKEVAELAAGGKGSVVCSEIVRYGLTEAGIFTPAMHMYAKSNGYFKFNKYVLNDPDFNAKYEVITVNKTAKQLLKEGNLLPGDICGWGNVYHTNIYAGNNKWYDAGRGAHAVNKNGVYQFKTFGPSTGWSMNNKIVQIVRLK